MNDSFPQIRAASIDGRAHNILYRQTQLERLCKVLVERSPDITQAIATDYGHSPAEIAVELHLTLAAVKRDYASLQPAEAYKQEYLLAAGKDASFSRKPAGIVYIEPCMHTMFYSVVVPLSAAIAAGNCVIVLLENNLRAVSGALRQILPSALDRDTFAIASSPAWDHVLPSSAIHVIHCGDEKRSGANTLVLTSSTPTVAVVDRTANVQLAARELVAARFSFGGQSPYAPDCVLVNEFVKQAFLQAVVSECVKLATGETVNGHEKRKLPVIDKVQEHISSMKQGDPSLRVILQERKMAVVDSASRTPDLLARKRGLPVLVVYAIRSLDDAIDLIGSASNGSPYLAAYHFGNLATGKYLAQFVDARLSFINNIPRDILVGPEFPAAHFIDPAVRFPADLFSVQRPAFIRPRPDVALFEEALSSPNNAAAQRLLGEATAPLAIMKRSQGGGVGFFEQGFFLGLGLILTTTISISGVGVYWWIMRGYQRL
ncbi:hypothetical protein LTR08_002550 [Meristemomyces frigidus]|nr:hypothetical protein LTR08_002550 [Meristemomyces frigidus]